MAVLKLIVARLAWFITGLISLAVSSLIGLSQVLMSDRPPTEWWTIEGWTAWYNSDSNGAILLAASAFGVAASLWLSIFQVFFSEGARREADAIRRQIENLKVEVVTSVAAVSPQIQAMINTATETILARMPQEPSAEVSEELARRVTNLFTSDLPAKQQAGSLIEAGDFSGAEGVLADLAQKQSLAVGKHTRMTAETWRELGALKMRHNVADAIKAYSEADRLDPSDTWTNLFLCRLHQLGGNLALARTCVNRALSSAITDHDRFCSLIDLGDIAHVEGDLAAARQAFEGGLAISQALAEADPRNPEAQRDLSISYNKLGDVARTEGDLAAARQAFENGLAIRKTLARADPRNEAQRDLSICYERLGDVVQAEGDLAAARQSFEDGLAIARALAKADPHSAEAQRDLSICYERLGDVVQAEGDLTAARQSFEDGLAIRKMLVQADPRNAEAKRDLSISYGRLGDTAELLGDNAAAQSFYLFSLSITERLAAIAPRNANFKNDLRITLRRIAALKDKV